MCDGTSEVHGKVKVKDKYSLVKNNWNSRDFFLKK